MRVEIPIALADDKVYQISNTYSGTRDNFQCKISIHISRILRQDPPMRCQWEYADLFTLLSSLSGVAAVNSNSSELVVSTNGTNEILILIQIYSY